MNIAIIGAGLSGTNIYNLLKKDNHTVTLFEKSRGAGGRCSTRYINDKFIDHGTPFFQTSNEVFKDFCNEKVKEDILVVKDAIYYPTNGINKLCSSNIQSEDLLKNTKIVSCTFHEKKWTLKDENNISYSNFDTLIITIPATQILELNIELGDDIKEKLQTVKYDSIATLIAYSYTYTNIMNPKLLNDSSFKKIIDNSSKYDYQNFSSYVIHLSEKLTNEQNFKNKDEVKKFMINKIYDISKINLEDDFHIVPHFWKYAFVSKSLHEEYMYDENLSLGICGDYFKGKDLEGAYVSSKSLYEQKLH